MERVLTDNGIEKITVKWDGTRFGLVKERKSFLFPDYPDYIEDVVVLNPKEMLDLIEFAGSLGGG